MNSPAFVFMLSFFFWIQVLIVVAAPNVPQPRINSINYDEIKKKKLLERPRPGSNKIPLPNPNHTFESHDRDPYRVKATSIYGRTRAFFSKTLVFLVYLFSFKFQV
ncbi:hypothetical protein BY996DRAFT_296841 [Phakopsora pachyrhizi]|nr:hypothetical protein BY996DRAFT_296841 [Phakopsora pachyrhizi]